MNLKNAQETLRICIAAHIETFFGVEGQSVETYCLRFLILMRQRVGELEICRTHWITLENSCNSHAFIFAQKSSIGHHFTGSIMFENKQWCLFLLHKRRLLVRLSKIRVVSARQKSTFVCEPNIEFIEKCIQSCRQIEKAKRWKLDNKNFTEYGKYR